MCWVFWPTLCRNKSPLVPELGKYQSQAQNAHRVSTLFLTCTYWDPTSDNAGHEDEDKDEDEDELKSFLTTRSLDMTVMRRNIRRKVILGIQLEIRRKDREFSRGFAVISFSVRLAV